MQGALHSMQIAYNCTHVQCDLHPAPRLHAKLVALTLLAINCKLAIASNLACNCNLLLLSIVRATWRLGVESRSSETIFELLLLSVRTAAVSCNCGTYMPVVR